MRASPKLLSLVVAFLTPGMKNLSLLVSENLDGEDDKKDMNPTTQGSDDDFSKLPAYA